MNGDVLTTLDYAQLMRFHKRSPRAELTIATHQKTVDIDLGVIESEDGFVKEYIEKPTMRFEVSMGVFVYDPDVVELIPPGHFDFPDVVNAMLEAGRKVAVYSGPGVWFDIGTAGRARARYRRDRGPPGALQGCLTGGSARRRRDQGRTRSRRWPTPTEAAGSAWAPGRSSSRSASPNTRVLGTLSPRPTARPPST